MTEEKNGCVKTSASHKPGGTRVPPEEVSLRYRLISPPPPDVHSLLKLAELIASNKGKDHYRQANNKDDA
ncbi:hypothetical protein CSC19_3424 [Enterobacter hormaechei]|nr:hypothetical protein CSC19_3424 [Enterobacter hormaechei]